VSRLVELKKIRETWNKHTKGWTGAVIYVVLGFAIALLFNNVILAYGLNTDTLVVAVFSNSMTPTFFKGDMIVVQGVEDIAIGDVIIFDAPGKNYPIIHRVYEITGDLILTKGDNNNNVDPWKITIEQVHGKAVFKIPVLGWVKILFNRITGF